MMTIKTTTAEEDEFVEANRLLDQKRFSVAYRRFLQAASQGNVLAQNSVGYLLDCGIGTRRQPELAMYWYRRAARNGDPIACTNLGLSYHNLGRTRLALKWMKRAADLGDPDGPLNLGQQLSRRKDFAGRALAKKYLEIAAASCHLSSSQRKALDELVRKVTVAKPRKKDR